MCDLMRNNSASLERMVYEKMALQWYEWISFRIRNNTPYHEIIRGVLLAYSRRPGESYENYLQEMSSYYRKENPADFSLRETMPFYWQNSQGL